MTGLNDPAEGRVALHLIRALLLDLRREGPLYLDGFARVLDEAERTLATDWLSTPEVSEVIAAIRAQGNAMPEPEAW